jgi:hypothetical protein
MLLSVGLETIFYFTHTNRYGQGHRNLYSESLGGWKVTGSNPGEGRFSANLPLYLF